MRATLALLTILAIPALLISEAAAAPRRVKSKGEIATIIPGKILLIDTESKVKTFNILPDREVSVAVQGTLAVADLKPGMLVRIEGTLKMNMLEGEAAKVTVYSLSDGYAAGIEQSSQDQPAVITGTMKLLKDDTLTLLAGKRRITAKLAKNVVVSVDSKDYTLAPLGSQIEADGYETKDGSVNAKKVVITIGKPAKKETKPPETKTAKTAKKIEEKK